MQNPPLSQEYMTYIPEYKSPDGTAKVIYKLSKNHTRITVIYKKYALI
jgi:hypothetical protein